MSPRSDKKFKTEEVPTSRERLFSLATAETARTASHVMLAGNAMLSSSVSPLLASSLNSIFSTLATSITYGRTPEKIQSARLKDLQTLIINIRPLFEKPEMPIFFAKSASYQTLKKQFEMLDKKYSARIESESKTFWYLMLAIGFIGLLYFVVRLSQESDELTWAEAIPMILIMLSMGYSNFHSHEELVMRSRKDYQEFIEALIQFTTHVTDEVPILKVIATLEQTQKEMEACAQELRKLGVEMPEIREADESGVEESKGAEKSLVERLEERLQSLLGEKEQEIAKAQKNASTRLETMPEQKEAIGKKLKSIREEQQLNYQRRSYQLIAAVEVFNRTFEKYQLALEQLSQACAAFKEKVFPCQIDADSLQNLKRTFEIPEDFPSEMLEEDDLTIRFRK